MEPWPVTRLKAATISKKLEVTRNAKSCFTQTKLLETRKVAKN